MPIGKEEGRSFVYVETEEWKNGWFGINLFVAPAEINRLIDLLRVLGQDPDQHFHISSDYKGSGGVGDIQTACLPKERESNMHLTSKVYAPGEIIARDDLLPQQ